MSTERPASDPPGLPETLECAPQRPGALQGVVLVTAGSAAGLVVTVPASRPVTFGRSNECTVVLDDQGVSRIHAEIALVGDGYLVRDRGSTNGTYVNGERVGFAAPLAQGDGIVLGAGTKMRFTLVDEAEAQVLRRIYEAVPREAKRARKGRTVAGDDGNVLRDAAMRALYERAARAASTRISVLIVGETGVGKELLARAIHQASPRAKGPFMALNCAALSETLLEAELFGHEKGAFTGADRARPGVFEAAEGGTVFLDEVGELPLSTQVTLLRVLEDRRVMRVGGHTSREVDVRFLSATHRDLEDAAKRGSFRHDLFFRLNGMRLTIPPLRERTGEIEELAALFLARACAEAGRAERPALSPEVRRALLAYPWPGNVRELKNAIESAVVLCAGGTLLPEHLPRCVQEAPASRGALAPPEGGGAESLHEQLEAVERQRITDVLAQHEGNQTRAAMALGISRRTLVARLQAWGLTRPRRR
jgi:DNA-binding NtrC family response regulator